MVCFAVNNEKFLYRKAIDVNYDISLAHTVFIDFYSSYA
jgi:hypothetical protein